MNPELHIAQRLSRSQSDGKKQMSRPAMRVAFGGIVIGVAVMILTLFIVVGFKRTVSEKVIGFGSHIQVTNYRNQSVYQTLPVVVSDSAIERLQEKDGIVAVSRYCLKPAMLKTSDEFQTVIFKGYDLDKADAWQFLQKNLVEGRLPQENSEILLSTTLARLLHLTVDTTLFCYFIQDNVRARRFNITGLYNTDFADYDKHYIFGDIRQLQTLNAWREEQISGLEINIRDFSQLERMTDVVYFSVANQVDEDGNFLNVHNVVEQHGDIFAWLDLLDLNVVVIIVLMLIVSGFSIISGLIILILEGIPFIGTIKALGADNRFIRRVFLYQASFLVLKGLLWGNIVGLGLAAVQYFFHIVPLDATAYYVSYVPVAFHLWGWLLLNVGTLAVIILMLLAPSSIIARVSPANVLRFE